MKIRILAAIIPFCALVWAAAVPFDIKYGLWEMSTSVQIAGMSAMISPEQLANMPEAMRKRMEAATSNPQTTTTKSCVTRENVANAWAKSNRKNDSCTSKVLNQTASGFTLHTECSGANTAQSTAADIVFERIDSEHVKATGTTKTLGANGRAMESKVTMNGKFLSSDCGSVKPDGQ